MAIGGLLHARGCVRQRLGGALPSKWPVELERHGREGWSSRHQARCIDESKCRDVLSSSPIPLLPVEAVCNCGNPGRWTGAGISNGCGKVRGWVAGGPELSTSGQLPQPGWGKASPAQTARRRRRSRARASVQVCVGASGLACGSACGSRRAACGPACGSARAACGVACGFARAGSCGPHPLPLPSDQLSRGCKI